MPTHTREEQAPVHATEVLLASPCPSAYNPGPLSQTALLCQASRPHTCSSLILHWVTSHFQNLVLRVLYLTSESQLNEAESSWRGRWLPRASNVCLAHERKQRMSELILSVPRTSRPLPGLLPLSSSGAARPALLGDCGAPGHSSGPGALHK